MRIAPIDRFCRKNRSFDRDVVKPNWPRLVSEQSTKRSLHFIVTDSNRGHYFEQFCHFENHILNNVLKAIFKNNKAPPSLHIQCGF